MAGSTRATMRDVASLAGVSAKTVSNVVTGSVFVRDDTRERVEEAMRKLDFVPNLSARSLRNGRSGVIALALPYLATSFSAELLDHIVQAARSRGLAVQVEQTGSEPRRERELLSRARAHLVDGLILNPIRLEDSALTDADRQLPVVLIGEVEHQLADHVGIDSVAGAAELTRHVIARGARRIAVVGGDDQHAIATATSRLRLQGVRQALAEAGLPADPRLTANHADWTMSGGAAAMTELLTRGVPFDAVLAFTDSLAAGALHVLHERGIRVPEDVLVTGFDDVELARFTDPALSTVQIDRAAFAAAAVDLLAERIADPTGTPRTITVPHRLIVRDSTAAAPRGWTPAR
ncbi:LacI family DNA-binding transcriptional regulator [Microbacterium azadirachtae]|uniref:HTH-type transcriptional regulator DegA n=1 Tax=Microbacterium azadirachtae TaxID=582680 RepID=A0A0F0KM53_9MICO|nr:LacI family DNA-binding transcriptional regulator [Microbacterium azadirachtae]KJL21948.1 HTH-type transcriptional regulator DegA [Microbacterium azadirachtae]UXW85480.1 LacI family transcriptional regulator [Microbacterium azadirachtae]SDM16738.1 DNA-binding transcriptional regulator, LacI/PurR family [Microbacterium azadirachtae]SEG39883.1 DNA-binding transcriptional regulator, LacI/PurR family [Microbacterium azadirachtae]SEG42965.1 DNA-binding transcriptional regulator, LacI/PurR family